MKVTVSNKVQDSLSATGEAFMNFRNSTGQSRPRYPDSLKRRALLLLEQGCILSEVARGCGVNKQSLVNWKKESGPAAPRRLQIIKSDSLPEKTDRSGPEVTGLPVQPEKAEVRFPNGLLVSLPVNEILGNLLRNLGGLERC